MKDKKFLALASFFFLLFFAGIATVALQQPTSQVLRAKNVNPSSLKSFIIVFPQIGVIESEASTKTPTQIKVSVYVRDESGSVLPGRTVQLTTEPSVSVKPADTVSTDKLGMAQFLLTSTQKGTVKIFAKDIDSQTIISNSPTIEFTE